MIIEAVRDKLAFFAEIEGSRRDGLSTNWEEQVT